jgi:hypothetical protein
VACTELKDAACDLVVVAAEDWAATDSPGRHAADP